MLSKWLYTNKLSILYWKDLNKKGIEVKSLAYISISLKIIRYIKKGKLFFTINIKI